MNKHIVNNAYYKGWGGSWIGLKGLRVGNRGERVKRVDYYHIAIITVP
jgi:hypothetical protein